jgi:thiamine biosynthesis protein ThiS
LKLQVHGGGSRKVRLAACFTIHAVDLRQRFLRIAVQFEFEIIYFLCRQGVNYFFNDDVNLSDWRNAYMQVNGKQTPMPSSGGVTTLKNFLEAGGYNPAVVAIEKNGVIIDKNAPEFGSEPLRDNDVLEIVHFMGGG